MRSVLILFSFVLLAGCEPNVKSHQQRINDDQLISLIADLHLEAAEQSAGNPADIIARGEVPDAYRSVLKKANIAEADFKETMLFLADHPDHLVSVYDQVIERLTAMQSEAQR